MNSRPGVDDVAEILAFPWLPGFKRYPPWILIPMCYAAFFLLWTTLMFGGRGSWGTLLVFVVATISISAVWSFRLRRQQVTAGVPVKIAGWRDNVRQLGTSSESESPDADA